jgi:hypothetical protein
MKAPTALFFVKLAHTVAWAFFAGCILLLPIAAHAGRLALAAVLTGVVLLEVLVLALNRWRCPLTGVAARYTQERQDNFDIFLPLWLARYNKEVFGSLFAAGIAYAAFKWWQQANGGSLG